MSSRGKWQLGDEELLAALRKSQARLNRAYGEQLTLLVELLARNLTPRLGYRTAGRLLQDLLRIGQAEANRRLAHAVAVSEVSTATGDELPPTLPATAPALRAGAVGAEHVEAIRRVITELPQDVPPAEVEWAELTLVDAARTVGPAAITKLGRAIHARLGQDDRPPSAGPPRRPANELHWTSRGDGALEFKGRLAAEGGALLTTVLGPLAKPRPAAEGEPDPRSRAARYGDALVDALRLAANSGDLPADGGERPTLIVTMTLDALRTNLPPKPRPGLTAPGPTAASPPTRSEHDAAAVPDNGAQPDNGAHPVTAAVPPSPQRTPVASALLCDGTLIDAGTARRLACDAAVIPAVLNSRSEPLDVGRKTRTVPAALRRALVLRDRGCAFPGCTVPASWCDAHHRQHWADGGATALPNLVLLCGVHHELIHKSGWQVRLPEGVPEFIPPPYIDPDQNPRRNPIHRDVTGRR